MDAPSVAMLDEHEQSTQLCSVEGDPGLDGL